MTTSKGPDLQTGFGGGRRVDLTESHDDRLAEEAIFGLHSDQQCGDGCFGPQANPVEGLDSRIADRGIAEPGDECQGRAARIAGHFPKRLRGTDGDLGAWVVNRFSERGGCTWSQRAYTGQSPYRFAPQNIPAVRIAN